MLCYAITDRKALHNKNVTAFVQKAIVAGIDYLQIREKDLNDKELYALVKECVSLAKDSKTKILVNDRLDIAIAAGADGVHLGGHSVTTEVVKSHAPENFIIGVSTHDRAEASKAESGGADFIAYGPVFTTPSKAGYGPPKGIANLESIIGMMNIPVFPLGGINENNLEALFALPIGGIASISLFQNAKNLARIVADIQKQTIKTDYE